MDTFLSFTHHVIHINKNTKCIQWEERSCNYEKKEKTKHLKIIYPVSTINRNLIKVDHLVTNKDLILNAKPHRGYE